VLYVRLSVCVFGDVAGAPTTIGRLAVDSPEHCRVGVRELASSRSLFEAEVEVPRIAGEVIVKLARVNMPEPSDASGWSERVDSPDGKHRCYFGNDGMDPASSPS